SRAAAPAAEGLSGAPRGELIIVAAVLLALGIAGAWAGTGVPEGALDLPATSAPGGTPAPPPVAPGRQTQPHCPPPPRPGKATRKAGGCRNLGKPKSPPFPR